MLKHDVYQVLWLHNMKDLVAVVELPQTVRVCLHD